MSRGGVHVLITEKARTKLNLGAGNRLLPASEGWLNTDRTRHRAEIEQTHDLEDMPWPWHTSSFTEIVAYDVLEHVQRPILMAEEIWRVAKPDAEVIIHTCWASPHIDSRAVWRDITHVRPFHETTFHQFDPIQGEHWFENYGRFYTQMRVKVEAVSFEPPDNILFKLRVLKPGSVDWKDDWA